ncbi:MAG: anti-sigma factor [Terriglobales bacterium]
MSVHEQFEEDLALYALNALTGADRANIERHLSTCPACRRELEQLRADSALLALSTVGPKPPQRSRQRLLDAIAKEPRPPVAVPARPRRSLWGVLGWAAAAAVSLLAASLWKENTALKRDVSSFRGLLDQQTAELERARSVVDSITNPAGQHFTLVALKAPPQPQGKVIYVPKRGTLIFLANNLPKLPSQKTYELWLIPEQGAPIPAGLFKPDAHGSATVVNPPLPPDTIAKAFAMTVEDEAGAASPTMPIVMMSAGE